MDPQTCSAIRDLLARYAAYQLTPDEQTTVEDHVATCLDCRTELGEWLALNEWLVQADAAIPRDTSAARSLAAIHARLDRPSLTLRDGSQSNMQAEMVSLRPILPRLPQRRVPAAVAWASVAAILILATSLFYLLAPQLHPHQNATNPTATATATTPFMATPKPLSGSWHMAPNLPLTNLELTNLEFSKSTPEIGYHCPPTGQGAFALYKSQDGGMTWRPVGTIPSAVAAASQFDNCEVIIDSNDANDVFVELMLGSDAQYKLWRSRDGGATWSQLSMPPLYKGWANLVVVGSRIIGLGTDDNFLNPADAFPTCSTDPITTQPHQVNDLFASDDGGKTWTHIGQPLINQGLSITPTTEIGSFPGITAISPAVLNVGAALFVRTFCFTAQHRLQQAYWKSSDGGETWTQLALPGSDMSFTPSATGGAYGVAVIPGLYGASTTPPRLLYSRDSGASWEALPSLGSIPLPPHFQPSAPGCGQTTPCHTDYTTPLVIALPDGTVLAALTVEDTVNGADTSISNVYMIDPQSPKPAWHLFAPMKLGAETVGFVEYWTLAATKQGLVLWAVAFGQGTGSPRVYLSPLP